MSFYINSNLSPTEAVKMHPELQVHPVIEEWAETVEGIGDIEQVKETAFDEGHHAGHEEATGHLMSELYGIVDNEEFDSVEAIKDALTALIDEL